MPSYSGNPKGKSPAPAYTISSSFLILWSEYLKLFSTILLLGQKQNAVIAVEALYCHTVGLKSKVFIKANDVFVVGRHVSAGERYGFSISYSKTLRCWTYQLTDFKGVISVSVKPNTIITFVESTITHSWIPLYFLWRSTKSNTWSIIFRPRMRVQTGFQLKPMINFK